MLLELFVMLRKDVGNWCSRGPCSNKLENGLLWTGWWKQVIEMEVAQVEENENRVFEVLKIHVRHCKAPPFRVEKCSEESTFIANVEILPVVHCRCWAFCSEPMQTFIPIATHVSYPHILPNRKHIVGPQHIFISWLIFRGAVPLLCHRYVDAKE